MRREIRWTLQVLVGVGFICLWEWASSSGRVKAIDFGKPSSIWATLRSWWSDGTLFEATASTVRVLLLGWIIGTLVGIAVGVVVGTSTLAHDILGPFLSFLYGLPRLIIQPFLVIWLGFGLSSKVVFVVLVIWITTTISVAQGCREIPTEILSNTRLLGANSLRLARDVYVPSLALWVVSSSRTTFAFAFQAAIISEFVGTNEGLGHLIIVGQNGFKVNSIYAALVVVTLLSVLANAVLSVAEARATRWMPLARR
jgi:NitT/TauT family transport system permease protein